MFAFPTEALIFKGTGFRLRTDQRRIACAVGLAEGVAARNQRDVSSSFIAMRKKVSRMSLAAATGSGLPFGPAGFT